MMKKLLTLTKKRWYFQGFNGTPALLYGPTRSAVTDMPKTLGYGYKAIIELFENDKCYFLYAWDDLYSILDKLYFHVRKDKNYLKFLLDKDEEVCKKSMDFLKKIDAIKLSNSSDEEVISLYKQLDIKYGSLLSVSHIVEGFTLTTEDKIRDIINKHAGENSNQALNILTAPLRPSFISIEQNELYKIVHEIKKRGLKKLNRESLIKHAPIHKMLKQHQKKYFWKNNSYASAKILQVGDFISEINEIIRKSINVEQKIRGFEKIKEHKQRKRELLEKISEPELSELIAINDVMFRLHDHRKEVITIAIHYVDMLIKEIGNRKNIPLELMRYIKPEELNKLPSLKKELQDRRKQSVFITLPEGVFVLTGKESFGYTSMLNKQRKMQETQVIKGNCASRGKATGIVKVCRGEKEISKVQEGNIVVACMTQPEFVPALKKAAAIVTDEGGLTCHAAIVSRELGIPCIIGTRIATKVLKDGNLVEVDANKGKVKILRR